MRLVVAGLLLGWWTLIPAALTLLYVFWMGRERLQAGGAERKRL
jgi:hypothetical protein